ncbi:hypothetical protein DBP19_36455 [Streptomyces sp. CS090A]|uniref:hypothetical protein n=1 Tax=Streptomyces sp. CS090A TaxID=2162710 RepID=UPI000D525224|nr:hypothetical protein [Streptomyces sp. CS090A]PVC80633.1 hypothetical protein DBP19_36455 [Streptomyces sp. CS090A]
MTTTPASQPPTSPHGRPLPNAGDQPTRALTRGQGAVLILATIPMLVAGALGAWGTYSNVKTVFPDNGTALGVVASGEGATLILAIVYVLLTLLGQSAPTLVRLGLWILPVIASAVGAKLASNSTEAVVYAVTPMAMCVAAEGIGLVARRVVVYRTGIDMEAQRRNAEITRRIAYHSARSQRHPNERVREESALKAWQLMERIGSGDAQLGSGLIGVQRDRLTQGADMALGAMLSGLGEPAPAHPATPALEPGEPTTEPPRELASSTVNLSHTTESRPEPTTRTLTDPTTIHHPTDQQVSREPVLIPSEPAITKPNPITLETTEPNTGEPIETDGGSDEKEQQIATLTHRLTQGDRLTKSTAAQLLGVSPATAGRRLKDARDRISEGTGMYL